MGRLEKSLLIYAGLRPYHSLLDVGCGPGRLAAQLAHWLEGPYLGTDVVQTFLDHAAHACGRPDWRFEKVSGLTVPADSESVDIACAFSVFTHLRHEESYSYMQDILRVLKPALRSSSRSSSSEYLPTGLCSKGPSTQSTGTDRSISS